MCAFGKILTGVVAHTCWKAWHHFSDKRKMFAFEEISNTKVHKLLWIITDAHNYVGFLAVQATEVLKVRQCKQTNPWDAYLHTCSNVGTNLSRYVNRGLWDMWIFLKTERKETHILTVLFSVPPWKMTFPDAKEMSPAVNESSRRTRL